MWPISIKLKDMEIANIQLGYVGENDVTPVIIDCESVFSEYPNAVPTMTVQPPKGLKYTAEIERDGNNVIWTVQDYDLNYDGEGEIQIKFIENGKIKKSASCKTTIKKSIEPEAEAPTPIQDWMERAEDVLESLDGLTVSAETLDTGENATAEVSEDEQGHKHIDFGLPRGPQGPGPNSEEITEAVDTYLELNFTNPSNPPLDRSLTEPLAAAPADVVGNLKSEINKTVDSDAVDVDLDITDDSGNVILRLANGHIQTKEFDSENPISTFDSTPTSGSNNPVTSNGIYNAIQSVKGDAQLKASDAEDIDLDLTDENGNVIMRLSDGHLETKGFDSHDIADALSDTTNARSTPLFTTIDYWEPEEADSGYSNPTADWGGDTKRADWTAEDKYYYYEFLAHYYDVYLGTHSDGYRVTKRSLGQDSEQTGYELFEYDFCPVNYKYMILFSAGMNADETQGIWGLATFMRAIMNKEETNMEIAYNNIRFKVIPIINASGFDKANLRYTYSDGVNPNYNFNYKDSWSRHTASTTQKGQYPDSNISTVILKNWINENAWKATLWVDLHTGRWPTSYPSKKILDVRVADSSMVSPFATYVALIKAYYVEKGYIQSTDNIGGAESIRSNLDYQKTVYAFDVCGIKSIMPEMHLECVGYGADGNTNNTVAGIKCYAGQLRAMMMCYINESASASGIKLDSLEYVRLHAREV